MCAYGWQTLLKVYVARWESPTLSMPFRKVCHPYPQDCVHARHRHSHPILSLHVQRVFSKLQRALRWAQAGFLLWRIKQRGKYSTSHRKDTCLWCKLLCNEDLCKKYTWHTQKYLTEVYLSQSPSPIYDVECVLPHTIGGYAFQEQTVGIRPSDNITENRL